MEQNLSLFFIRHSKLLLPYKNHSKMPMEILVDLALKRLDPPIDQEATKLSMKKVKMHIPFCKITQIYTSSLKRCQSTTFFIRDFIEMNCNYKTPIVIKKDLEEVYFELDKIIDRRKGTINISMVNDMVFSAMDTGKHCEPISNILKRVDKVFSSFIDNRSNSDRFLIITHDFLMRVIEIYIKNKGDIKEKIGYKDLKKTERNNYLSGFATNFHLSFFIKF